MMDGAEILSCDWGSTSFRLRWLRGDTVLREIQVPAGVRSLYEQARQAGAHTETARAPFFEDFLRGQIERLWASEPARSTRLPLFISGMASSSVGWRELPYAPGPFPLDGSGLVATDLDWPHPAGVGRTVLISGLATSNEMMRGEETEILGLMVDPALARFRDESLIILPGTHSKHIRIENNAIVDWRTFMTGELFDVLGTHSLLRASVDVSLCDAAALDSVEGRAAFDEGVLAGQERGLAETLFHVRTRTVLGGYSIQENTQFFSGLLIGAELAGVARTPGTQAVLLAAAGRLAEPYARALSSLARAGLNWIRLAPEQVERAVSAAHARLAARF